MGAAAKKSLGQNFLVDPNLQQKIVEAVEAGPADTVIEVGPGRGALTHRLAPVVGRLVAVELDDALADALETHYRGTQEVTVVHADILEWDPSRVLTAEPVGPDGTVRVVGNIPYNITSPLLFRLLEWRPVPERIIVMVQREVADRILAAVGEKAYGALTVGLRAEARVERLFHVGRQAFRPVPNVDSTVLAIRPRERGAGSTGSPAPGEGGGSAPDPTLRALTRAAFSLRRKQFQKILRTAPEYGLPAEDATAVLAEVGVAATARPETVDPDTFIALAAALKRRGYPRNGAGHE